MFCGRIGFASASPILFNRYLAQISVAEFLIVIQRLMDLIANIVCLDMEGVLVSELRISFANDAAIRNSRPLRSFVLLCFRHESPFFAILIV